MEVKTFLINLNRSDACFSNRRRLASHVKWTVSFPCVGTDVLQHRPVSAVAFFFVKPIVTRFIATFCCLFLLPHRAADPSSKLADQPPSFGPKPGEPWENTLGMKFVPVPGTSVLFCIW